MRLLSLVTCFTLLFTLAVLVSSQSPSGTASPSTPTPSPTPTPTPLPSPTSPSIEFCGGELADVTVVHLLSLYFSLQIVYCLPLFTPCTDRFGFSS